MPLTDGNAGIESNSFLFYFVACNKYVVCAYVLCRCIAARERKSELAEKSVEPGVLIKNQVE